MHTNEHELPSAALPSISEIPFLDSSVPAFLIQNISVTLRALRGAEIVSTVAPLQRMRSNCQAFKPTRPGDRSQIGDVRAICGLKPISRRLTQSSQRARLDGKTEE
jgi:hypothetical protein